MIWLLAAAALILTLAFGTLSILYVFQKVYLEEF